MFPITVLLHLLVVPTLRRPTASRMHASRTVHSKMQSDHEWSQLSVFARMKFLRSLLDETTSKHEVNRAVWLGLRRDCRDASADMDNDNFPDVFNDAALLQKLESQLPDIDSEDGLEQLASLDLLIEILHGAELTRLLVQAHDADFAVRRTVVRWLAATQPELAI